MRAVWLLAAVAGCALTAGAQGPARPGEGEPRAKRKPLPRATFVQTTVRDVPPLRIEAAAVQVAVENVAPSEVEVAVVQVAVEDVMPSDVESASLTVVAPTYNRLNSEAGRQELASPIAQSLTQSSASLPLDSMTTADVLWDKGPLGELRRQAREAKARGDDARYEELSALFHRLLDNAIERRSVFEARPR